jgi:predicted RNase H-like nuclease (RuvC/YqgF family)
MSLKILQKETEQMQQLLRKEEERKRKIQLRKEEAARLERQKRYEAQEAKRFANDKEEGLKRIDLVRKGDLSFKKSGLFAKLTKWEANDKNGYTHTQIVCLYFRGVPLMWIKTNLNTSQYQLRTRKSHILLPDSHFLVNGTRKVGGLTATKRVEIKR